jgi:N6-adenosine-specific RNA methylase IME4
MKKYQIIYADPPWEVKAGAGNLHIPHQKTRDLSYPTMSLGEIQFMGDFVKQLADDNSVLFLWTINKYLEQSYTVARQWGFTPSTMLVWCKKPKGRGLGGTFGTSTEYLLFCRRGSLKAKERHWSTWFEAKRGIHSEKPELVMEIIEKCFDGDKMELFARKRRDGWDSMGFDIDGKNLTEPFEEILKDCGNN